MRAVNWAGTKEIIDLELSLYLLKQTIICKSYDVEAKITSVLSLKTFTFIRICLFFFKIFVKLLIFNRNKVHPNVPNN